MPKRLEGQVAVVTGAGRGIGRAVAKLLAEEGASVVVNDLGCDPDGSGSSRDPADHVVAEIRKSGGKALATYDDVADMNGAESTIKAAIDNFGTLDILVNSVGIRRDAMLYNMTEEDWDAVIRTNMKGTFCPTKFAGVWFRQQRKGRVICMVSDDGLGAYGRTNLAAANEGLVGFVKVVSRDMGKYNVTVNAVSPVARTRLYPGSAESYLVPNGARSPAEEAGVAPLGPDPLWKGPGTPDDPENVAPVVVYLCTPEAKDVNSWVIGVQGGDIYLYSHPTVDRGIYHWGPFTVDELVATAPRTLFLGAHNPAPPRK